MAQVLPESQLDPRWKREDSHLTLPSPGSMSWLRDTLPDEPFGGDKVEGHGGLQNVEAEKTLGLAQLLVSSSGFLGD